jgi:hypothetical protein
MYDPLVEAGGTDERFQLAGWQIRVSVAGEEGAILRARGNAELTAALKASLVRERASQQANAVLLQTQRTLALEFDHRFLNGLQWITAAGYSLSVLDDGPGLPSGVDPAHSKGLGMAIVLALVKQIRGTLKILPGDSGRGTKFTVYF